jgi:hypothetical protein
MDSTTFAGIWEWRLIEESGIFRGRKKETPVQPPESTHAEQRKTGQVGTSSDFGLLNLEPLQPSALDKIAGL